MPLVTTLNPYREGSKLAALFREMNDGEWHTLDDLARTVYHSYEKTIIMSIHRSRISSALRTIRRDDNDVDITYRKGLYQMTELRL